MTLDVVVSASYDKLYRSKDDELLADGEGYKSRNLMPSIKFARVVTEPIEELKFLMPLYGYVPSVGILAIRAMMKGARVAVVGGTQVKKFHDLLSEYVLEHHCFTDSSRKPTREQMIFADEGDTPSLAGSMQSGKLALGNSEKFGFVCGDIPLAELNSYFYQLTNFNSQKYDLGMDFNARERIFEEGKELFPRNYYAGFLHIGHTAAWIRNHVAKRNISQFLGLTPSSQSVVTPGLYFWKEPNKYIMSDGFDDWPLIDILQGKRTAGQTTSVAFVESLMKEAYQQKGFYGRLATNSLGLMLDAIVAIVAAPFYHKLVVSPSCIERLGHVTRNISIQPSIDHTDPFSLKDIDAWHDLFYYRDLFSQVTSTGGIESIFDVETASVINGFNVFLSKQSGNVQSALPLVYGFENYAQQRARKLRMTEYFDTSGNFIPRARSNELVADSVRLLRTRQTQESKMSTPPPFYNQVHSSFS